MRRFSVAPYILKLFVLGPINALGLWAMIILVAAGNYWMALILLLGLVFLDFSVLAERAYPLRYILPAVVFMLITVVYPILYTGYVSFTNSGTGHILTREQALQQFKESFYLPEDAKSFSFNAYKNSVGEFAMLFTSDDGSVLLGKDGEVKPVDLSDSRLIDGDGDGIIDSFDDYRLLPKRDLLLNLAKLQHVTFHYGESLLRMRNISSYAEYKPRYIYDPEKNTMTDLQEGKVYREVEGTFVAEDGKSLNPGFRTVIGSRNYWKLVKNPQIAVPFLRVFVWTFEWAFLSVLLTFALGLAMAIVLNDPYMKLRGLYRVLLVIPYSIPAFIAALVWRGLFNTEVGVINALLSQWFGISIRWLQDPFWAKVAVLIVNLWLGFPYMMIIALGALQSIPQDVYEAALVDGATWWQQFRRITLPLLLVSLGPLLISSFAFNFNNFNVIYLVTEGRPPIPGAQTPAGATDILISYTYRLAFESGRGADYGLASAVTVVIFLIVAVITFLNFRFTGALEDVKRNV